MMMGMESWPVMCGVEQPHLLSNASITIPVAQGGDELLETPLLAPPLSHMATISHLGTTLGAAAGCYPTLSGGIC